MVDSGTIGGTCVNVGCVPSKRLLAVGDQFFRVTNRPYQGLRFDDGGSADFRSVIRAKDRIVGSLRKSKYADVLASLKGVEYVRGRAAFVTPNVIKVGTARYEGRKVVIATGSSPTIPPIVPESTMRALPPFRSARIAALNAAAPPPKMMMSYFPAMPNHRPLRRLPTRVTIRSLRDMDATLPPKVIIQSVLLDCPVARGEVASRSESGP